LGTAENAGVLACLGVSIATFPLREIRKRRHEAVFETSVASRRTEGSNPVPSSDESSANSVPDSAEYRREAAGLPEIVALDSVDVGKEPDELTTFSVKADWNPARA
jgi:hypothetical protein